MRKDGMLLFINVALGLCLGAGVATFVNQALTNTKNQIYFNFQDTKFILLLFLFMIYFFNLIRTFLGFVKFYQDESLYDSDYEKIVSREKLCIVRLIDFLAMMFIVVTLVFQGLIIHLYATFAWVFLISSVLFVIRNGILTIAFDKLEKSSDILESQFDKIEIKGRSKVVKKWFLLDTLFLFPSILLLFGVRPTVTNQQLFFGFSAAILLFITWLDIWGAKNYYFGSAFDAGQQKNN